MKPELTASGDRHLTYLRLSVTDLCNLRCRYCMPSEGVPKLRHQDILSYEELLRIIVVGSGLGLKKIRLTGGEPLVRRGLAGFIRQLRDLGLFSDLCLTTNGILLPALAGDLKEAGTRGINISLDALDPVIYAEMAGRPGRAGEDLARRAWAGFRAALDHGFKTKINCVPIRGANDGQLTALARLVMDYPVDVRFIEHMPIGLHGLWTRERFLSAGEIMAGLTRDLGELTPKEIDNPSAPARLYTPRGARGSIGFISAISNHFCGYCNRLRLTADGKIKACLLTDQEVDLKSPLRAGASDDELREIFLLAAGQKPVSHLEKSLDGAGSNSIREMSCIGG